MSKKPYTEFGIEGLMPAREKRARTIPEVNHYLRLVGKAILTAPVGRRVRCIALPVAWNNGEQQMVLDILRIDYGYDIDIIQRDEHHFNDTHVTYPDFNITDAGFEVYSDNPRKMHWLVVRW